MKPLRTNATGRLALLWLLVLATLATLAACGGASAPSPSPAPAPTPTPVVVHVTTPEEAAALVLATDTRFQGVTKLNANLIGASAWWTPEPIAAGGFRITVTKGWGDCPAGCINRHVWIFEVSAAGAVTLVNESGDALPEGPIQP